MEIKRLDEGYNTVANFFNPTNITRVVKRQAMFIAAALTGGLSGLFGGSMFGLYNGARIEKIETAYNQMEHDRLEMVHVMKSLANAASENRLEINKLETAFLGLSKQLQDNVKVERILYLINLIDQVTNIMQNELSKYHRIITSSVHHRLPYGIFSKEESEQLIKDLQKKVENTNYKLGISQEQHLYQLETSILFKSHGKAALFIHVPIVQDYPLKLYKFHGFPIPGEQQFHVNVRPRDDLIAVDTAREFYVEFSPAELSSCTKIYDNYICPHLQELRNMKNNPSCLTSLLDSDEKLAGKLCPLEVSVMKEVVVNLGKNHFLAYHNNKTTATKVCQNGESTLFQVNEAEIITVDDGCQVILPGHKLYGISELEYQSDFESFEWTLSFSDLLPHLKPSKIEKIMMDLKENSLPPLDPAIYKTLDHLDHPHFLSVIPFAGHLVMGSTVFLLIVFVIGMIVFCCAYHRCCCFNIYQAVPSAPIIVNDKLLRL